MVYARGVTFEPNQEGLDQAAEELRGKLERVVGLVQENYTGHSVAEAELVLRAQLERAGLLGNVDEDFVRSMAGRIAAG
jgi:hypothetical protein